MAKQKLKNELVTGNRSQAEQNTTDLLRFYFRGLTILPNDKTAVGKELDIYIPEFRIAIEIDGVFHQRVVTTEETFERMKRNDLKKSALCEAAGIKLIRITLPENSAKSYAFLKEEIKNKVVPEIIEWTKSVVTIP